MAEEPRKLLTVQDVADRLQVHPETIRRWIRDGRLTAIDLGADRRGGGSTRPTSTPSCRPTRHPCQAGEGKHPMSEHTRVHIYARVSSAQGQEDGYSLDTQEAACRAWAAERALPVASVAHEVWSGGDRHRPELDALLDRLMPGDVLLSYDLDRLSRGGQVDTAVIIDRIECAGASVAFVTLDFEKSETGRYCGTSAPSPPPWNARRSPSAPSAVAAPASTVASRSSPRKPHTATSGTRPRPPS